MLLFIGSITVLNSCKKTKEYAGYKLIEKRFVKEVNADVYFFEHVKSGARVVKIAANDPNKTFGIGFKTEPESDAGTPHIIEHSVLNGSKNYPCKSPFDELGKGSLKTFLNAFTSSDFTFYPVASMNNKDYFNLMNVYMDAVFYPLIHSDPRILKQEGWHYEMTDKNSPVVYKGVVFNEMKGAFSSPERELSYQISRNLFPDNGYRFSSGGYPSAIPSLTYEHFTDYHKRHYNPTNSYIYLYGDADMEKELRFLDSAYLSSFEKIADIKDITPQKPFDKMKEYVGEYPAMEGTPTTGETFLSYSWVIGQNTDVALVMSLNVLADVVFNMESAPVRLALEKAGIGKDVSAYVDNIQQNVLVVTVKNANPDDKAKFIEIVNNTLREVSEKGLDKEAVEGVVNRYEFSYREGNDSQKGLSNMMNSFSPFMFSNDPFLGLEWEKPLAEVKKALTSNKFEEIIKTKILSNNHALVVVLNPKPGMEKETIAKEEKILAEYKTSLTPEQQEQLIKETNELIEYQKREDTPEALATIPALEIKDINPKADWFAVTEKEVDGNKILHYEDFTNNIVYTNLLFDTKVLTTEQLKYASLLTELLVSMSTEKHTFGDLDKIVNINTGGIYAFLDSYAENDDDNKLIGKFVVSSKAMNAKTGKMFELLNEILNQTKFNDPERLKSLLTRTQSRLSTSINQRGLNYAITRNQSYYSNKGMFNELTRGFEYYWFINDLVLNFDKNKDQIIANLQNTAKALFKDKNLTPSTTCSKEDFATFTSELKTFRASLDKSEPATVASAYTLEKKNEGFLSSSKVQYVIKGYNFKKLGYDWNGKLLVLNKILSSDWLQTRVRVMGGAYGGWSSFSSDGDVYFGSYRDPNLKETLDNYDATCEYLKNFNADEKTMTKYIIGTISNLDQPLTVANKGNIAVSRYFKKMTPEKLQEQRTAVLSTTAEDIKNMEKMVSDILKQNTFCVFGNKEKIEANSKIFGKVLPINKG